MSSSIAHSISFNIQRIRSYAGALGPAQRLPMWPIGGANSQSTSSFLKNSWREVRAEGERAMLRIYIHDEVPVTSFVLEGKLVGPWVEELEKGWESALAAYPSRMMLVDLADVSFIDSKGQALLARMRQKGARLLSTGVLINAIVAEIDAEQRNRQPHGVNN
jgi:ABC-type transporter Mla MlaB component